MERYITSYMFEVGICEMRKADDGRFDKVSTPICTVEDGNMTRTKARKAIIDAGHECPRGADVYWRKVAKVRYPYDFSKFKTISESPEVIALD